jgi:hypothetical protein
LVSLILALPKLALGGSNELPFGPGLALGSLITWLGWTWIGSTVQVMMFHPTILGIFVVGCGAVLLIMSFLMGRLRPSEGS